MRRFGLDSFKLDRGNFYAETYNIKIILYSITLTQPVLFIYSVLDVQRVKSLELSTAVLSKERFTKRIYVMLTVSPLTEETAIRLSNVNLDGMLVNGVR